MEGSFMESLNPLYIFASVFGVGVLIIDLMGVFNQDDDADVDDTTTSSEGDGEDGSDIGSKSSKKGSITLKILSIMQSSVYFALGFGATGMFAIYTGESELSSLIWSLVAGIILMIVAKLIKSMQKNTLSSEIDKSDLLMEKGEIIVPIEQGKIGKVRVQLEDQIVDRFAKSKDTSLSFSMGERVTIEEVTDEYLFIDKE